MKYRSSLLDEDALVLEANKALNRGKAHSSACQSQLLH